ncbi:hypothetical protein AB79_4766 [Escherichia coli 6-175-07_S1_C3]|nr:hypothetical protein AB50_4622 [Escherichia coli 6-175-07_S1_C2]KEM48801.1 hypothetical protein AB79_4766 [Escherichia coli 6-175-07_S1_C3]
MPLANSSLQVIMEGVFHPQILLASIAVLSEVLELLQQIG